MKISHKMTILSIAAMLGVVLIHSRAAMSVDGAAAWNVWFTDFICMKLTAWCVPMFFLISGFWFIRGNFSLKKKVRSLLLPYFCWACIGALVVTPLVVLTNWMGGGAMFARTFLEPIGLWGKIDLLLAITQFGPIGCGVLWYVRSLLFCFLLAPVWFFFAKRRWGMGVLVAWAVITLFYPLNTGRLNVASMALTWFPIGMLVAKWGLFEREIDRRAGCVFVVAWIFAAIAAAFGYAIPGALPLLGVLAIVSAYDGITWLNQCNIHPLARETFWIYCNHQIIAGYLTGSVFFALGKSDAVTFSLIFVTPVVSVSMSLLLAVLVKKLSPFAFGVLTGGRG